MTENKDRLGEKERDKEKVPGHGHDHDHDHDKEHGKEPEKDREPMHDRTRILSHLSDVISTAGSRSSSRGHSPQGGGGGGGGAAAGGDPFYRTACVSVQSELLLLDLDEEELAFHARSLHKDESFGTQRVYKKTSPNCVLTLYLPSREITLSGSSSSIMRGIVFVDPKAIQGYRVYAQLTLTFRYGREDEEVMGLRFCNEAIMSLHQVWPRNEEPARESLSPLQDALVKRLGDGAHPFTLTLTPQAPPSVQLVPAKRYYGAPIGTSYDVRCFIADKTDEKFHRRASVKMGVRVIYRTDVFHQQHSMGPENFAALINSACSQTAPSPPMTATRTSPPAPLAAGSHSAGQLTTCCSSSLHDAAAGDDQQQASSSEVVATTGSATATSVATTAATATTASTSTSTSSSSCVKARKSERGDSFPKLRLSPKSFRFSGRFGRSKSEIEKCPNDPFYNYSKSFQEYDSIGVVGGGGPQGAVDKPFLLQDGRVGLRASLDKAWYTHGEDVSVTISIRNDSRKTVRKVRVCAIQHVDVCMFNNGKFKNVVADSDNSSPVDRTVPPGGTLNTTVVLRPQRGPTKNWIALEDTLQRSTEPEEITGYIAASAIRSPIVWAAGGHTPNPSPNAVACCLQQQTTSQQQQHQHQHQQQQQHHHQQQQCLNHSHHVQHAGHGDDRNVFAIYVSYYVKVKLTLSGMGGELSLKLPFVLVHVDEAHHRPHCELQQLGLGQEALQRLALDEVPRKNGQQQHKGPAASSSGGRGERGGGSVGENGSNGSTNLGHLDRIESIDDEVLIKVPVSTSLLTSPGDPSTAPMTRNNNNNSSSNKRKLIRSETIAKDDIEEEEGIEDEATKASEMETETEAMLQAAPLRGHKFNASNSNNNNRYAPTSTTPTGGGGSGTCGQQEASMSSSVEMENVHVVQIHSSTEQAAEEGEASKDTAAEDAPREVAGGEGESEKQSTINAEVHANDVDDV